jgi:hypothetical protein
MHQYTIGFHLLPEENGLTLPFSSKFLRFFPASRAIIRREKQAILPFILEKLDSRSKLEQNVSAEIFYKRA